MEDKTELMRNQESLKQMADSIKTILKADVVIVDKNMERVYDTFPYIKGEVPSVRPLSVIGEITKSGAPLVVNDKSRFHVCEDCPDKKKCLQAGIMGVPIFANGQVEGALALVIPNQGKNTVYHKAQATIDHMAWFARMAGGEIERQRWLERAQRQEARSSALLEDMGYPAAIVGDDGSVEKGNHSFRQWLGSLSPGAGENSGETTWSALLEKARQGTDGEPQLLPWQGVQKPVRLYSLQLEDVTLLRLRPAAQPRKPEEDTLRPLRERGLAKSMVAQQLLGPARAQVEESGLLWLYGEPMVGKRALAQAVHAGSARWPLDTLACGNHGPAELQRRLFGNEDAERNVRHLGALLHAQGGSLLLEDVEQMPLLVQARLAEVLARGWLSWNKEDRVPLDLRVTITSRYSPGALAQSGQLHEGLAALFEEKAVLLPPLRQRRDDAIQAFKYFLEYFGRQTGRARPVLTEEFFKAFADQPWNQNLQEIQALAERVVMNGRTDGMPCPQAILAGRGSQSIDMMEKNHIEALLQSGRNKSEVARLLHIGRATLYRKMKKYVLDTDTQTETGGDHG